MEFWLNVGFVREVEQLPALAEAAEAAGFDGVTVPHRFAMPTAVATKYPYTPNGGMFWPKDMPFPDPWVAIGAMAARTERIRLVSNIYLMALHDPFTAARMIATASVLSGGRVICGVSSGWLAEEFELAGVDFKSRGRRLNEMIDIARKLWTGEPVAHEGEHFQFPEVRISPAPSEPIPIFAGGASRPALRRVVERCQGWLGLWYSLEEAVAKAQEVRALRESSTRAGEPLEILLGLMAAPTEEALEALAEAGVTGVIGSPWKMDDERMTSLAAKQAAIEGYAARFLAPRR